MRVTNLTGLDLNLVTPLAALLEERHVSRAARRVGLTQPAMSHALRRLRTLLGDELLVRGAGGYVLTPRAERLQRRLAGLVPELEQLFAEEAFDPAAAAETFAVAGTDYAAAVFGPRLARDVLRASPGSSLRFGGWHEGVFDDLVHGRLDLVFYGSELPAGLRSEVLFEERFACVVAGDDRRERLSLADYLACSHVSVEITGGEQAVIDRRLDALGRPRRVALRVPYHLVAAAVVPGTPLVATLPVRLLEQYGVPPGLRSVPAPEEIEDMTYAMAWHPRLDGDLARSWLRSVVRAIAGGS